MTAVIDPQFSVYHLVQRIQQQSAMLHHRRTMSLVSYEIENATIRENVRSRIFAGFQAMSRFLPQVERYRRLAANAETVYVFGVRDVEPPPIENVTYIPLSADDQLSREWFLVSYGPEYFSALATEEVTRMTDPDASRVFKGLWTFDPDLVDILAEWLTSAVDAKPYLYTMNDQNRRRQLQFMNASMNTLLTRITERRSADSQGELQTLVNSTLQPAVATLTEQTGAADGVADTTDEQNG